MTISAEPGRGDDLARQERMAECRFCKTAPGNGDAACRTRDDALQCIWLRGAERAHQIERQLRYLESCNQHLRQKEVGDLRAELSRLRNGSGDDCPGYTECEALGKRSCPDCRPSDLPEREAIERALVNYDAVIKQHHHLVDGCINKVDEAISELVGAVRAVLQPLSQGTGEPVDVNDRVIAFATAVLHGDDDHKTWLLQAAHAFVLGKPLPAPYGKGTAAPPSKPEGVREALEKAKACFEAAVAEGLYEQLAQADDSDPGSLAGLVNRRLVFALGFIDLALDALATTPSPGLVEVAEWQNKAIIALEAIAKLQGPAIELGPAIASGFFEARTLSAKPIANADDREGDRDA